MFLALGVIMIVAVVAASTFYVYQASTPTREVTGKAIKLTWARTGGFAGLDENLVIEADGTARYTSNLFGDGVLILDEAEVEDLMETTNFFTTDRVYTAKPDAADYFIYRLTVQTTSGSKTIEWVDEWASQESLSPDLLAAGTKPPYNLVSHIENIIERIRQQTD